MLQSALSLPRNDRRIEAVMQVDIAGTQQLIADQFGDSKLAIDVCRRTTSSPVDRARPWRRAVTASRTG
ncbi:hypothetical protein [Bradyrhizobium sp. BR 10261]|uniref:hypothetical protein n=1 Tax=Bradyrhizobium sp. BR 10261 TaxID=2749992 RepID=UPI001E3CC7A4|nr:hypothetical protein [Bradyrhizobium sp. BR 10261]